MNRAALSILLWGAWATYGASAAAQPVIVPDPAGDVELRRTDLGGDGLIDPQLHRLPDIVDVRRGRFLPLLPEIDLFSGTWSGLGGFMRVDLVFAGHINPPGPLGFDSENPQYEPFRYGPNPVYGFVEFDADADENSGGELETPDFRYLGVAGRWGGLPSEARFLGRAARHGYDFDNSIVTPPFVDRSGEEFHLALLGEHIGQATVRVEKPGGNPAIFEDGEIWEIRGDFFHRSHGWENYLLSCPERAGLYQPVVTMLFGHDSGTDRTTVSLVYPLTNQSAALMVLPPAVPEANNGCDYDLNSVEEALADLRFSAENADPGQRLQPEFQLIAGWEFKNPQDHLDPAGWRICANLGTAYGVQQSDGSVFAWTDVLPNVRAGDFNGDSAINAADGPLLTAFVAARDGNPLYDDDGNPLNASLTWHQFATSFAVFDTQYDGVVSASDIVVLGDMNLNQSLEAEDAGHMAQALADPPGYLASHDNVNPRIRGDLNGDYLVDSRDLQFFLSLLLAIP